MRLNQFRQPLGLLRFSRSHDRAFVDVANAFFSKVVVRRNDSNVFSVHSGDRKWVTTIEYVSCYGQIFPPTVIFAGKKIRDKWAETWPDPIYSVSDNGWTNNEIGLQWLQKVFHPTTVGLGGRRLLVIDGHVSHVSVEFIEFCWEVDIVPLCLPPHTTHYLQPLDVGCFGPLDQAYRKQLDQRNKTGVVHVTKEDFLVMLKGARKSSLIGETIRNAWAKIGKFGF